VHTLTLLREVEALYTATVEPDYIPLARTRFALARAMTGERPTLAPDAASLADQALAAFTTRGAAFASETGAVAGFIASHTTK